MTTPSTQTIIPGKLEHQIQAGYAAMDAKMGSQKLFEKDASFWKTDEENVKSINNRLGWLDMPGNAADLLAFAEQIKGEGYKYTVLLGMGGSSLCSEVARQTFARRDGYPELLVLDNTAPDAILSIQQQIDISKTLFIAASKSGGTMETVSFFKYFYKQLQDTGFENPGKNFVAITDEGTSLVTMAMEYKFRKVFINRGDIGGRYSVLSDFGLLPMALMGIDIKAMLATTQQMRDISRTTVPASENPAVALGVALGVAQRNGHDKVTFVMSPSIQAFGYWVEQLIAESTGKEGKGLIPVTGESLGRPEVYTDDRVFVHMYLSEDDNSADESKLRLLAGAGFPIISINVADRLALGGEYYRWEIATAISGAVIGINPFNEPNVAEGKKNTNDLLAEWSSDGSFKMPRLILEQDAIKIYGGTAVSGIKAEDIKSFFTEYIDLTEADNYISLLCYFEETDTRTEALETWRMKLRDSKHAATTFAYGPRYLHSTGQLHKGGPSSGVYIIFTGQNTKPLAIPGQKFGFDILNEAQSLGDFRSLNDKGRKVIYIRFGENIDKGLKDLLTKIG